MNFAITYLIEFSKLYILIFIFIRKFKERKCLKINVTVSIFLLILNVLFYINKIDSFNKFQTYFCGILSICAIVYVSGKLQNILLVTAAYMIVSLIDMILAGILAVLIGANIEILINHILLKHLINCLSIILFLVIHKIDKFTKKSSVSFRTFNTTELFVVVLGIVGAGFYIAPLQILGINQVTHNGKLLVFGGTTSGMIIIIITVMLLYKNGSIQNYREIQKIQEEMLMYQKNYYTSLLAKEDETRRFRHDINEHLYCISELLNNDEIENVKKYISDLNITAKKIRNNLSTGSHLTDIIVNDMLEKYNDKKVKFLWEGKFPEKTKLTDKEVCALFYNLLKNAFEAVENVDGPMKNISVELKCQGENIYISVSNSATKPVAIKNNRLITSKIDSKNHGYGTQIIREIVKRYGWNEVKYSYQDRTFTAEVILLNIIL